MRRVQGDADTDVAELGLDLSGRCHPIAEASGQDDRHASRCTARADELAALRCVPGLSERSHGCRLALANHALLWQAWIEPLLQIRQDQPGHAGRGHVAESAA